MPPDDTVHDTSPPSRLRRLDDVLVPRLQRLARPVGRVLGLPGRLLRGLDDRVAGGRPARSVREHPGLLAFVAVLLLFGAATVNFQRYPRAARAGARRPPRTRAPRPPPGTSCPAATTTPPRWGRSDPSSRRPSIPTSRPAREALADAADDGERVAVVSFDTFLEPGEAAAVLRRASTRTWSSTGCPSARRAPPRSRWRTAGIQRPARRRDRRRRRHPPAGGGRGPFHPRVRCRGRVLPGRLRGPTGRARGPAQHAAVGPGDRVRRGRHAAPSMPSASSRGATPCGWWTSPRPTSRWRETTFYGVLPSDQERFTFGRQI